MVYVVTCAARVLKSRSRAVGHLSAANESEDFAESKRFDAATIVCGTDSSPVEERSVGNAVDTQRQNIRAYGMATLLWGGRRSLTMAR